jgi:hypothetical protein
MKLNTWVKATLSGGNQTGPNCVECLQFRKASESGANSDNCVLVATADEMLHVHCPGDECLYPNIADGSVLVRDSKLGPDSPVIVFTADEWVAYTAEVAAGRDDRDGGDHVIRSADGIVLRFTDGEWAAFTDGCQRNEFALVAV